MRPSNNQGFRNSTTRQQSSAGGLEDLLHANPYVVLEQAVSTFMNSIAQKEQGLKYSSS